MRLGVMAPLSWLYEQTQRKVPAKKAGKCRSSYSVRLGDGAEKRNAPEEAGAVKQNAPLP